jgi:methylmalonyl-CoA mutase N-terminal domain/subunit
VQQEIQNASYEFQQRIDRLEQVVVGVNAFHVGQEKPIPLQRIDEDLERKQVERLRAFRLKRNAAKADAALSRIGESARNGNNLMPLIIDAVESECTVGEIADAMRKVFGEYKEVMVI